MRTGKDVPNHGFGALGLRDARIELAKFGFGEPGPWAAPPIPGCEQHADFSKREPLSWQSRIKATRSVLGEL